jgi:hypothetical protein
MGNLGGSSFVEFEKKINKRNATIFLINSGVVRNDESIKRTTKIRV